ncbi:MAG TPA: nitrilase-related carbon-nitrogen hydrolase, partial [Fibrobacteraceae bacterium]|nr:nitrilase-related carbon-nitrogen hydrolase [Fibrobacteraceae bacterium]
MRRTNISWIQGAWQGDAEATQRYYLEQAGNFIGSELDLLVLPELVHTAYFPVEEHPRHFDCAIPLDHKFVHDWADMARKLSAVVVFPFFEKRAPGVYQNSALVFERDGSIVAHYRKSHIPDDPGFYEKYYFMPGDEGFQVVSTSAGRLGLLICWDQWFPEAARILALQGAELLIYPTAIGWDVGESPDLYPRQLDAWRTAMRAHSIANGLFTLAVNRTGDEGPLRFWGNSFLCGPDGFVLHQCDTAVHTASCTVD